MLNIFKEVTKAQRISKSFDRKVLLKTVFPTLLNQTEFLDQNKNALWIGCRLYTRDYYSKIERKGATVKTIDIDRYASPYGKRGAHTLGSANLLTNFYRKNEFDIVFCNGVIGWGVNDPSDRKKCYEGMREIMKPDALLLLGWNTHKTPDPLFSGDIDGLFSPVGIPGIGSRLIVPSTTHVFDMLSPVCDN